MKIIGHRGAKGLAPENTLASVRKALQHKVDAIEFDVRLSQDGIVVATHDANVHDPSGSKLSVAGHTYDELKAHNPDLATLTEIIEAVEHAVPLIIEIKSTDATAAVIATVKSYLGKGWEPADFAFISFNFGILRTVKTALPEVDVIVNEMWSSIRAYYRARKLGTNKIDLFTPVLWSPVVSGFAKRGFELYTFPINDVAKARRWQKAGLAGVVTDFPDRFES
jgi:glycerophosphoryl diester phosphodiesterase